jgi:hypothetical protein
VLVRAALPGLLLPATDNLARDRDIFLRLMTMDAEGLRRRKSKPITQTRLLEELQQMAPGIRRRFLDPEAPAEAPRLHRLNKTEREGLQRLVFDRLQGETTLIAGANDFF